MDCSCYTLREIVDTHKLYVPVFQRNYSWTVYEVQDLLDDLLAFADVTNTSNSKYLGHMILQKNGEQYAIIDGQQRLLTFVLMLLAAQRKFNKFGDICVTDRIAVHNSDAEVFARLCKDQDEGAEGLMVNYRVILDYFEAENVEPLLQRLKDVRVSCLYLDETDDVQGVLSSCNTTGRALSDIDLIRNLSLMGFSVEEQLVQYKESWAKLDEASIKYNISREELFIRVLLNNGILCDRLELQHRSLFQIYKQRLTKQTDLDIPQAIQAYLTSLDHINQLTFGEPLQKKIMALRWGPVSVESFLMNLQVEVVKGRMDEDTLLKLLNAIDSFCTRSIAAGITPQSAQHSLDRAYAAFTQSTDPENRVHEFYYALFCEDSKVSTLLKEFTRLLQMNLASNEVVNEYILKCMELKASRKQLDFEDIELTAIVPTKSAPWTHYLKEHGWDPADFYARFGSSLANYMLVESTLPFDNSDPELCMSSVKKSQFALTRGVAKCEAIDPAYMESRMIKMILMAEKLWAIPEVPIIFKVRRFKGEWFKLNEISNTRGIKPTGLKVFTESWVDDTYKAVVKSWKALAIIVVRQILNNVDHKQIMTLMSDPKFNVDDEQLFSKTLSEKRVEIAPQLYMRLEGSSNKIVKQLAGILDGLGLSEVVQVRLN